MSPFTIYMLNAGTVGMVEQRAKATLTLMEFQQQKIIKEFLCKSISLQNKNK